MLISICLQPELNTANQNGFRCRRERQAAKGLPKRTQKKSHRLR
jgi:hypothetical protein